MVKRFLPIPFTALLVVSLMENACRHEIIFPAATPTPPDLTGTPCSSDTVYFQNQILPLLTSSCAMSDCHNTQFHTIGIDVTSYDNLRKLIVPGNANASVLYTVVTSSDPTSLMPVYPAPIWTTEQSGMLRKWIQQGATNNACNENYGICDTSKVTYTNFIRPLITGHCEGCHVQDAWGGGVVLNTYADVQAAAQSGQLYASVAWTASLSQMPKFGTQLPDCFVRKVDAWVKAGMPQ